ncbi:MAG: FGGY-family carbohydrate kinase [Thiohalospira sp.]
MGLRLGIDIGTSGCRAAAIDMAGTPVDSERVAVAEPQRDGVAVEQDPALWWEGTRTAIRGLLQRVDASAITGIAVDGTSGTVLVTNAAGEPLAPALLYNDARATDEGAAIDAVAPPESPARGAGSGAARALWLLARHPGATHLLHQADWITGRLTGRFGHSDPNNALKTGWDPVAGRWPAWLEETGLDHSLLPAVHPAGTDLGPLDPAVAADLGLPAGTRAGAGTTDSTAAVLAAGAAQPGDAVTVLGSTLVLKVVSPEPVAEAATGVYSQPFGRYWLAGGASNSGGAVLRRFFDDEQLAALTPTLDPEQPTGLDYYPLPAPGERFPDNDPDKAPRMEPRPAEDAKFLQGLLEGMSAIEAAGYARLRELGAPAPRRVMTLGGGARNPAWTRIREHALGVAVSARPDAEPAAGTARLAPV